MTGWRRKIKSTVCPLIHTPLEFTLAQDAEKKKNGAKDSAVL
jgi:hypothetical protein